jgi:hypothetical protein
MQAPLNLSGGRPLRDYDLWATVLVFNVPSMGQSVGATTPVAIFAGAEHTGLPRQALQASCGARQCGTGHPPGKAAESPKALYRGWVAPWCHSGGRTTPITRTHRPEAMAAEMGHRSG